MFIVFLRLLNLEKNKQKNDKIDAFIVKSTHTIKCLPGCCVPSASMKQKETLFGQLLFTYIYSNRLMVFGDGGNFIYVRLDML